MACPLRCFWNLKSSHGGRAGGEVNRYVEDFAVISLPFGLLCLCVYLSVFPITGSLT